ncbi:guanylate kinase [Aliifodinibius sp. S!AR15-10]|uniref:guanylate kinase n=1 Tax=Aliifodinibius sp. S!AR15-10 TaxID=2950437 RepID=UPI002861A70F|nr:guanylate kinase [Aliifodinibius sp. S!AR15-10]MDR8391747.1 guanylate kinase [Aliifodinibius sp. S!AR15-10]
MSSQKNKKGKVIIIVAPSGSGKTTIANMLLEDIDRVKFSTSATTRSPREGEKNGREYFFLTDEEFYEKIQKKEFLEWEHYGKNRYGTLRSEVDKLVESGYFPLLDIEVKGALNVKQMYGSDCIAIFIKPPSMEELKRRLLNRESETEQQVQVRLEEARKELQYADEFDYVVVNDDLEEAYSQVKQIVTNFIS